MQEAGGKMSHYAIQVSIFPSTKLDKSSKIEHQVSNVSLGL